MSRFAARLSLVLLAAVFAVGSVSITFAQTPPANVPVVVGVLDVQLIMRDSKAAKSVKAALDKQAAAYQAELAQQENALRNADQQLMQQRASLPADEFNKKSNDLGLKVEALRQTAEKRRQQLQKMENGAMIQIEKTLLQAAADIAKQRGISLVLNKSAVLLNVQAYDITQEALKRLDAQLTSVKLPAPQ